MVYENNKLMEICLLYDITPMQFFILYSVFRKDKVLNIYSKKKQELGKIGVYFDDINYLMKKGYLLNFNNTKLRLTTDGVIEDEVTYLNALLVPYEFSDKLFIDAEIAGEELYQAYPHFLSQRINGQRVVAKKGGTYEGIYYDEYKIKRLYTDLIRNDYELHNRIIECIEKAKRYRNVNVSLREFVLNKLWNAWFHLDDDEEDSNIRLI